MKAKNYENLIFDTEVAFDTRVTFEVNPCEPRVENLVKNHPHSRDLLLTLSNVCFIFFTLCMYTNIYTYIFDIIFKKMDFFK